MGELLRAFILFSPCSREPKSLFWRRGTARAVRRAKFGSESDSRAVRGCRSASRPGSATRAPAEPLSLLVNESPGVSRTRGEGGRPSPHARRQRRCASRSRRLYDDLDALVVASASWGDRARCRDDDAMPDPTPIPFPPGCTQTAMVTKKFGQSRRKTVLHGTATHLILVCDARRTRRSLPGLLTPRAAESGPARECNCPRRAGALPKIDA